METYKTIFAVLADLEAYAEQNGLNELRDTIRSTRVLAVVEMTGMGLGAARTDFIVDSSTIIQ